MGLVTEAKRWLEALPPEVRERLETMGAWVPRAWLYGSTFRETRRRLQVSQWWPQERIEAMQGRELQALLHYAYRNVPYYKELFDREGIRPEDVRSQDDFRRLPTLDRETLHSRRDDLVSRTVPESRREVVLTGGSTGAPISFWLGRDRSSVEWAFVTLNWERAGYTLGARRAVLRGWVPSHPEERLWERHPLLDEIVLSTFHITPETAPDYARRIREFGAEFLVAYPSSADALARALREAGVREELGLRAVLLSSEALYEAQRRELEETLGARVFGYYGQSEKTLLAGECERSQDLHFFPEYGYLEVLDEAGRPVGEGETGELVATSFVNRVTVLLRYRTRDLGTRARGECACGRQAPRLTRVEGRTQDLLVAGDGSLVSVSALNSHSMIFDGVERFRIVQEVPGEARLLVLPGRRFDAETADQCAREYEARSGGRIRFRAEVVDSLPLTGRGKYRFVDQRIPLDERA